MDWETLEMIMRAGARRVYIWGKPGLGKTFMAKRLLQRITNKEPVEVTLFEDAVAQELLGHYVPVGNEFQWRFNSVGLAVVENKPLVVNELHRASQSVQDAFLSILDDPARMTTPEGKVEADELYIVATANEGPECLDPALYDRFDVKIQVKEPPEEVIELIDREVRGFGLTVSNSYSDDTDIISVRDALTVVKLVRNGIDFNHALKFVIGEDNAESIINAIKLNAEG